MQVAKERKGDEAQKLKTWTRYMAVKGMGNLDQRPRQIW